MFFFRRLPLVFFFPPLSKNKLWKSFHLYQPQIIVFFKPHTHFYVCGIFCILNVETAFCGIRDAFLIQKSRYFPQVMGKGNRYIAKSSKKKRSKLLSLKCARELLECECESFELYLFRLKGGSRETGGWFSSCWLAGPYNFWRVDNPPGEGGGKGGGGWYPCSPCYPCSQSCFICFIWCSDDSSNSNKPLPLAAVRRSVAGCTIRWFYQLLTIL